ncbi:hypothetical protein MHYP_G00336200 [Metynnis hypsauchen]
MRAFPSHKCPPSSAPSGMDVHNLYALTGRMRGAGRLWVGRRGRFAASLAEAYAHSHSPLVEICRGWLGLKE